MLRTDISEIFTVMDEQPHKAVYVVKHTYEPRDDIKYLNTIQYKYPRKNWSSVVLWNCDHEKNRIVTPQYINTVEALALHRFTWLDDNEIGDLDIRWNWLVGEYNDPPKDVRNVHWTMGGPYFDEYANADFSQEWFNEMERMQYCSQRESKKSK
jgi:hypothetical protein